jgi:hypothetical protein
LDKTELSSAPTDALIVYRLGHGILNPKSGVRFPVGAPIYQRKRGLDEVHLTNESRLSKGGFLLAVWR